MPFLLFCSLMWGRALPSDCIINVEHLWTRVGKHEIHRDISLCIKHSEIVALVGASGSGKTTLLQQMIGLRQPSKGSVTVFGLPLDSKDEYEQRTLRSRWGVLFQHGALFSALNVFDNVALPLRETKYLDNAMVNDLVMAKLEMVGLEAKDADKMPAQLSGGMVKRVALARALALEPELLFLDEPTSGLDPVSSEEFVTLMETLKRELDLTIVMVTHDLETLAALADKIAVLAEQRLVGYAPLKEIYKIDHSFIQEFFCGARGKRALHAFGVI